MYRQYLSLRLYCNAAYILASIGLTILLANQLPAPEIEVGTNISFSAEDPRAFNTKDELSLSANDHALSYPFTKNENVDLTCCFSTRGDRLIRSSLFDEPLIEVLTEKLAWFTGPAYYSTLASLWRPSILIAQRKLTI
jgi:hypothetical protein